MVLFSSQTIDELLAHIDIVEIISQDVGLKPRGSEYYGLCPFHADKTPSFTVNPARQLYYCFGCNAGGSAITFVMQYHHHSYKEAIHYLANHAGFILPPENNNKNNNYNENNNLKIKNFNELLINITDFYHRLLINNYQDSLHYLTQERGITIETIHNFSLGYVPNPKQDQLFTTLQLSLEDKKKLTQIGLLNFNAKNNSYYNRFCERILFPIYNYNSREEIVGFGGRILPLRHNINNYNNNSPKYLNSPDSFLFHKRKLLYGLYHSLNNKHYKNNNINNSEKPWIVVEGYLDVITLHQYGFSEAVAPLGTALTPQQLLKLCTIRPKIIFCFDGDRAGQLAMKRVLELVWSYLEIEWTMQFIFLPAGHDPDSFLKTFGPEAFQQQLDQPLSLFDCLLATLIYYKYSYNNKFIDFNDFKQRKLPNTFDRASFIGHILPYIKRLTHPVLQETLLQTISEKIGIRRAVLTEALQLDNKFLKNQQNNIILNKNYQACSILDKIFILLTHHPELIQQACSEILLTNTVTLQSIDQQMADFSLFLLDYYSKNKLNLMQLNSAIILEQWRDHSKFSSRLLQASLITVSFKPTDLLTEWHGLMDKLTQIFLTQEIEQLQEQVNQNRASPSNKQQLQQLLMRKNKKYV